MGAQSADDLAAFVHPDDWGEEITYTLAAGGDTAINAIFDDEALQIAFGRNVDLSDTGPQVLVVLDVLPSGHARGDTLTRVATGETYTRQTKEPDGNGMIVLHLEKN